jgi:uncharacterized protein YggU (UPF0235/DUF167 family)
VQRYEAGVLHVRVAAPPVGGAANTALIELLSSALHVPRTSIQIDGGISSREKRVIVEGREAADLDLLLDGFKPQPSTGDMNGGASG